MNLPDFIGASGVFLLLLAFILAGTNRIDNKGKFYFFLNSLGAGMACYASVLIQYLPFVVLEGAWTVVSVAGFLKAVRKQS